MFHSYGIHDEDIAMLGPFRSLFSEGNFMPHGMCYLWRADVLGLHVVSDALIALAYFSISFTLAYVVQKRKDLQFHWMFICFAVFIVTCAATHLMEVWVIWHPTYWLSGSVKAITAAASVPTAILLVKLIPQALQLPSPSDLRLVNEDLRREIVVRERVEADIRQLNGQLEERVTARTRELEATNRILRQAQLTVMQHERLRALGQMASGIAHDINNALTPAALYSRLLLEKEANLSDNARECLADILRSVEDVVHTVSRLKEFSRAGEPQLRSAPVAVKGILDQVIELTRARWQDMPQERGIVIRIDRYIEPDLPAVLGVESEIRDALVNLILNAVDAMPAGGTLALRSYAVAQPTTDRNESSQRPPKCVRIEVCDSGIGMTEEVRRHCLEPFFTTKGERGSGLGLAMVYGMVQRHRAEIEIASQPQRGTTVSLSFPPAVATNASDDQRTAAPRAARSLRILLIDDDSRMAKSLRKILEADGHHVSVADGGQAGIDMFIASARRGEPYAIVLADIGMPHIDGRKVAAAIKGASPRTPIVLVTGWGHNMLAANDIPLHADRILSKPPDVDDLRRSIVELTKDREA